MSGIPGTSKPELKQTGLDGLLGNSYQALLAMNVFVEAVIRPIKLLELEREVEGVGAFDDVVYHQGDAKYILLQAKHKTSQYNTAIQGSNLIADFSDDYSLLKYIWSYSEAEETFRKKNGSVQQSFVFTNIPLNASTETGLVTVRKKQPNNKMRISSIKVNKIDLDANDIFYLQKEDEPKVEFYQFEFEDALLELIRTFKPIDKDKDKLERIRNDKVCISNALSNIVYAVKQCDENTLTEIIKEKIRQNFKVISPDTVFNKLKLALLNWMTRKPAEFPLIITYDIAQRFFTQNLKKISFEVIPPISSFIGRQSELKMMKEKLQQSPAAIISPTIKIDGPNGIGKTEICRQYIKLYRDDYYGRVVWINAEKKESLEHSFEKLCAYLFTDKIETVARKRKHNSATYVNTPDLRNKTQIRIGLVLKYFENVRVLFVFDNVVRYVGEEDGDYIRYFRIMLRNTQSDCHIIINSKDKEIGGKIESIDLNVLNDNDGHQLIKTLFEDVKIPVTDWDIEWLAYKLEYFPLAIHQVVAYIKVQFEKAAKSNETYEIRTYIKELEMKQSLDFKFQDDLGDSYEKTTFLNFSISIDDIKSQQFGENAWKILQFMAYLDNVVPHLFLSHLGDRDTLHESIELLKRYCLIKDTDNQTFSIHRLLQKIIQIIVRDAQQEEIILEELLKLIFNTTLTDKVHMLSVWWAAFKHKRLLEKWALDQDCIGRSAIHYAAFLGSTDALTHLLTIDEVDVDKRTLKNITPLHLASLNGHPDVAKLLIQYGADVNATENNGYNALHLAAQTGYSEIVKLLVDKVASIDAQTTEEWFTPLLLAASNGYLEIVKFLVNDGGADLKVRSKRGFTPLKVASSNGHLNVVEFLVDTDNHSINETATESFNAVHVAAQNNHSKVVNYLIDNYLDDIDERDEHGYTSLHIAAINDCYEVVELLLVNNADVNAQNNDKFTPLHLAAKNGNDKVATLLINRGADPNARGSNNISPLMIAVFKKHTSMVEILIKEGAEIDVSDSDGFNEVNNELNDQTSCSDDENEGVNDTDDAEAKNEEDDERDNGEDENNDVNVTDNDIHNSEASDEYDDLAAQNPLHLAVFTGHIDIFKYLFENSKNTDIKAHKNYSLLHLATQDNHIAIVEFLVEKKIDVNVKADEGVTPLYIAAENGFTTIVKILVENGADKNANDDEGYTPIFLAAQHDHYDIVSLLLDDTNVNVTTTDNSTPLHMAAQNGNKKMTEILLEKGALVNEKTTDGCTPLYLAVLNNHCDVFDVLCRFHADLHVKCEAGINLFYLAAQNGNSDIAKFLINNNVNYNEPQRENVRPLHAAASKGHLKVVKQILFKKEVDVNMKSSKGITPLHLASKGGHLKVVKYLLRNKADINARTLEDQKPLDFVDKDKHPNTAEYLIKYEHQHSSESEQPSTSK